MLIATVKKILRIIIYKFPALIICFLFKFLEPKKQTEIAWHLTQKSSTLPIYNNIITFKTNVIRKIIAKHFVFNNIIHIETSNWKKDDNFSNIQEAFVFKDENSLDIQSLLTNDYDWVKSHFQNDFSLNSEALNCVSYKCDFHNDNSFHITTNDAINHWVYIASKKSLPLRYVVEFDYESKTCFREQLQIDFIAKSLADRFRIDCLYGKEAFFDKVINGLFIEGFNRQKCSLPINEINHIRLEIDCGNINFIVNGCLIMNVQIKGLSLEDGHLILLFWNWNENIPIDISISNFQILIPPEIEKPL